MDNETVDQQGPVKGLTTPDAPTHEATSPPNQTLQPDAEQVRRGEEELGKAGAGH